MPKVPKVTKLQNLGKKEVRHKFHFFHGDKNQSFLEAYTIAFGGHNLCNIFAISQERREA